jgi:ribonuclease T2
METTMSRTGINVMMLAVAAAAMGGCKTQPVTAGLVAAQPAVYAEAPRGEAAYREGRRGEQSRRRGNNQAANNAPGSFDYYLLTLSWSPEFCVTHPDKKECAAHAAFVLHGLWPENNDGSYPDSCSGAAGPANPAQYSDIYPDQGLLLHEWEAHGTCSGLPPDGYFAAERSAVRSVKIPQQLQGLTQSIQLTPDQIITDFAQANPEFPAGSIAVSCGNNRLTAVQVCLSKGLAPMACQGVRSCRANVVKITPPGAVSD